MTEPKAPDAGEVLRLWLRSLSAITATVGTRVGLSLTGTAPAIRYAQIGPGRNLGGGSISVRYQIECWGAGGGAVDDGTSDNLARTIMSEREGFVGIIGGARVSGADMSYPYRQDDAASGRPRNIVEATFVASPS